MISYPILFYYEICQSVAPITGRLLNFKLKMTRREATLTFLCVFLEGPRHAAKSLRSRCFSRDSKGETSEYKKDDNNLLSETTPLHFGFET